MRRGPGPRPGVRPACAHPRLVAHAVEPRPSYMQSCCEAAAAREARSGAVAGRVSPEGFVTWALHTSTRTLWGRPLTYHSHARPNSFTALARSTTRPAYSHRARPRPRPPGAVTAARRSAATRARRRGRARLEPARLPPARSRRRPQRRGGARDGAVARLPRAAPRGPAVPRQAHRVFRGERGGHGAAWPDGAGGAPAGVPRHARHHRATRVVRASALGRGRRLARGARLRHHGAAARLRARGDLR